MPARHLTEYNTLRDNALHLKRKLNTDQYTETLVRRRAFRSYVQRDILCPCVT